MALAAPMLAICAALRIRLLEWDNGMLRALGRGTTPLRIADWISSGRITLKRDHAHPAGAAHHRKIVVIDDRLLRVGASNLNNRSLGLDTECDLSVEAEAGDDDLRRRIARLCDDLLAEHLGQPLAAVQAAVAASGGSLIAAVEALRGKGRSLRPFDPPELDAVEEEVLAENALLDPERPSRRFRPVRPCRWCRRRRG